jgi:hypothetical protein
MVHNNCETLQTVIRGEAQFILKVFGIFQSKTTELLMTASTMILF